MLDFLLSYLPLFVFVASIIVYFIGRKTQSSTIRGIGIGMVISYFVIESPDISQSFVEGFKEGIAEAK